MTVRDYLFVTHYVLNLIVLSGALYLLIKYIRGK